MGLSIRNREVERLARALAERRGISMTEAIRQALENEAGQHGLVREPGQEARLKRMLEIARNAAALPVIDDRSEEEILGYDDRGIPPQ